MMGFGGMGWGWGGMLFGGIFMILFWVFVVAAVVWLVTAATRRTYEPPAAGPHRSSASAILDERLARGEIDLEEYKSRKAALESGAR
ncbi:MAG: SHOCT domain-containing protein [Chloroflexota bacterium]|nr:SHOCT domain-containing protein [Chloroflexota bacterium]MDE3193135.1 SHOCT domain-containing protein [Chloroflexota bacterium]